MANTGHIFIYGEIGNSMFEEGVTAEKIQSQLKEIKAKKVILHINSLGGSVFEGQAIYNILKGSGKDIEVIVEGMCASIATMIALAGNKITMYPMAAWLIHNPFASVQGDAEDLKKHVATLEEMTNQLVNLYVSKTGKEAEAIRILMKEDRPMYAAEAMEIGFIDEIVEELKAVARIDMKDKNPNLVLAGLAKLEKLIAKLIPAKNMNIELEDGTKLFVESEDGELVDKKVYTTDAEGNSTGEAAPNGDHKLIDGRMITVADGTVTAVMEAESSDDEEEMEALKKELEAVKAELTALKTDLTAKETALNEAATGLLEAKNLLKSVKMTDEEPITHKKPEEMKTNNLQVSGFILNELNTNRQRYAN